MDKYHNQISHKMRIIEKCGRRYRDEKLANLPLKPKFYQYIISICHHPGISQEKLAQHLFIDKGNAAKSLSTLEEEGYITRKTSESDRRILEVYPAEKSLEIIDQLLETERSWETFLTSALTAEETQQLNTILEKLVNKARNQQNS